MIGVLSLLGVLAIFSLFNFKAPHGAKAMGAMADAAVASFLVEAILTAVFKNLFPVDFMNAIGQYGGQLSGVAACIAVTLALGVKPVYAVMVGLSMMPFGILPGFMAGYLGAFVILWIQDHVPEGVDLIATIFIGTATCYAIASLIAPVVDVLLLQVGSILTSAQAANPIVMGMILGGVLVVTSTAPLSSMAITAMLGLKGVPMAIGALAIFGSGFMNYTLFRRLKLCSPRECLSAGIEALTQAHVVSANPIVIYSTNFVGGAISGVIIALSGLVNNTPGTAAVIPGFLSMFAHNESGRILPVAAVCVAINILVGWLGSLVFKNYKVVTAEDLRAQR